MRKLLLSFIGILITINLSAQELGGPYTTDENTVLLMHFDGNLNEEASGFVVNNTGTEKSYVNSFDQNLAKAIHFDNNNLENQSFLSINNTTDLNLVGSWTIEMWFMLDNLTATLINKPIHEWWGQNYNIHVEGDGHMEARFSDANSTRYQINTPAGTIEINKWYYVRFINDAENDQISLTLLDENQLIVYKADLPYASGTNPATSTSDLYIGNLLDGYIDELRISNIVRTYTPPPPPEELDQVRMNRKISALNLHQMKHNLPPFDAMIEVLSAATYQTQKPADALIFDVGYVDASGKVYVCEPTTEAQLKVFTDINQAAIYYVCQSFLQYYYQTAEMPIWFKCGFAAYEADMRVDDADIEIAYNNYGGTLTSFDVLNDPISFEANNGFAVSYMFGEFMGVLLTWDYNMILEVNATTIVPAYWWGGKETIDKLFEIWLRYINVRILEEDEQLRIKLNSESTHFKYYYRDAENFCFPFFSDLLEEAIVEYMELFDFEVYEKFSYITMPACEFALIGGRECVNLRYTGGTAWSSGLSTTSPDNAYDFDRFRRLIRHELAHLVQRHIPVGNMTAWLNEGFAQFVSHGPLTQTEIDGLQTYTEQTLEMAKTYFGHLPTYEDTKVYPGQSNVDYYLLGEIMLNFIYENGGYATVKDVMIDHETGIANMGFTSVEAFMAAYYHYVDVIFLKIAEPDYFTNYDTFITKLTNFTSSTDNASELNTFWDDLIATGNFPFAIDTKVAFLYRGSASSINWAGEFNGWDMYANAGNRLGVSNVWLLEMEFLADTRSEYKIVRNGSEWLADPNNPLPLVGDFGNSELWMPDYSKHTELISRLEISKGTLSDNIRKFSSNLSYTSQYRVYTPANYSTLSNLPTIYVTDGQNYLDDSMGKMVIVLDNLIADGLIEPVIAIFLDPRDPDNLSNDRRGSEYRNNINFVNYVTQELIPEIDATFRTNSSADARGIMGASWGGYNASYFCVKAASYFRNIGMNSAYLHPNGDYSIDADLQATNLDGFKLYLSYGKFDADGERYFNRLKDVFDQKGKEYEFTIVGDGHTWKNWSRVIGDALEYFYPNTAAPPVVSDIPDQIISEGSSFITISLDDFVTDADNSDNEITWSYNGNTDLTVSINASRVATITIPNAEWTGSETITFTATDPEGDSDSDDATFTKNLGTGIFDYANIMFSIYPNPITKESILSFNAQTTGNIEISIYDMQGRKQFTVIDKKLNQGLHSFPLSKYPLSNGVYIIRLSTEGRSVTLRMIISEF